ncbi:MAG TPA: transposase [Chthonomonadaceae bacterium]|nr:transposase [Chthonomonadaceae bacterium]
MNKDYRKSGNRVHNLNLHIVFCPKYRRKCLVGHVSQTVVQAYIENQKGK